LNAWNALALLERNYAATSHFKLYRQLINALGLCLGKLRPFGNRAGSSLFCHGLHGLLLLLSLNLLSLHLLTSLLLHGFHHGRRFALRTLHLGKLAQSLLLGHGVFFVCDDV
jgi:hypothetical protein